MSKSWLRDFDEYSNTVTQINMDLTLPLVVHDTLGFLPCDILRLIARHYAELPDLKTHRRHYAATTKLYECMMRLSTRQRCDVMFHLYCLLVECEALMVFMGSEEETLLSVYKQKANELSRIYNEQNKYRRCRKMQHNLAVIAGHLSQKCLK